MISCAGTSETCFGVTTMEFPWHLAGWAPAGRGARAWGLVGQGFLPVIPSWKLSWS